MFYLEIDFQGHSIKKQLTATRLETQQLQCVHNRWACRAVA